MPPEKEIKRDKLSGAWARGAACVLSIVLLVALVIRATVRDANFVTSSVYYAFPWTIIAGLALGASGLWILGNRRTWATVLLSVSCLSLLGIWVTTVYFNPCINTDDATRLVFWNIARGRGGWELIANEIEAHDADIVALTEAGRPDDELKQFWIDRFPDYQVQFAGGGMMLMSRLLFETGTLNSLTGISSLYKSKLVDEDLRLFLVDLDASPRFNKLALIRTVFEHVNAHSGPTIVLGDFNAPLDARGFDEIRNRYHHAFESAGTGLTSTWPTGAPLVAIDHIWLSHDIVAECTRVIKSRVSDHRAIVADIRPAR